MPELLLGPLLRHVGETDALIWVETDAPCEVEVLGKRERTFCVCDRHYALVHADGLSPGTRYEYEVRLDGERVWPPVASEFPPSGFQHLPRPRGRCGSRSAPVAWPRRTSRPTACGRTRTTAGARSTPSEPWRCGCASDPREEWPHLLLMLGDQVYADEVSPATGAFAESRRDTEEPPGDRVLDYEEYARLYQESWSEPVIRWLLSTVSTAMIFDDHDVHDDWNISQSWVEEMRATDWWDEHVVAGLMSYWVYQHLGNLAPGAGRDRELLQRVREAGDGAEVLREFAFRADRQTAGSQWSYCRDVGGTRVVVVDSRAGRVLEEGRRSMVDEEEWDWITDHARGDVDHLLIATSLPFLLGRGMHYIEAWGEAVAGGAWGPLAARAGERLRRTVDLEHWAAFQTSFAALAELQRAVAAGERGAPPASIVTLSGDVHHAYLYEVAFPRGSGARSSRVAGRVLALPQPARLPRAARDQACDVPPGGGAGAAPRARGGSGRSGGALAPGG